MSTFLNEPIKANQYCRPDQWRYHDNENCIIQMEQKKRRRRNPIAFHARTRKIMIPLF